MRYATCHYASKQVAWAVANLGRLRRGRAVVLRALAGSATRLELALELCDLLFVSARLSVGRCCWLAGWLCSLLLHRVVLLLQ
jgi:hypothetical protein